MSGRLVKNADLVVGMRKNLILPSTQVVPSQTLPDYTQPCRLWILSRWRAGSMVNSVSLALTSQSCQKKMFAEGKTVRLQNNQKAQKTGLNDQLIPSAPPTVRPVI